MLPILRDLVHSMYQLVRFDLYRVILSFHHLQTLLNACGVHFLILLVWVTAELIDGKDILKMERINEMKLMKS